ncbi:MAG: hypothetical protein CL610_18400 [Anaerolineaceae bacterium]|nr:hypothetical protein [Anaerolineaceae bacterium]
MKFRLHVFLAGVLLLLTALPALALQQTLPASPWYAVVWNRDTDMLHWVNEAGEQATLPRPKLAGEAATPSPAVQFSRDGRHLLVAATLQSGVQGLGIFDVESGQFVRTHQAASGETINLGATHTSNISSQRMAVGLANTDPNAAAWRVLIVDVITGDAVAELTNSALNMQGLNAYRMPLVVYYDIDEALGHEVIHFQMLPINAGGVPVVDTWAWNVNTGTVVPSAYNQVDQDIRYLSGEVALAVNDPNYESLEPLPMLNTSYNAIARGIDFNNLLTIWADGTRHNFSPKWAANGQWLLYYSEGEPMAPHWSVIMADATPLSNERMPLGPNVRAVWGTPDGYLALTETGTLLFMNEFEVEGFAADFGVPVLELEQGQSVDVVYVSDAGAFGLTSVADVGGVVVDGPDELAAPPITACEGAPPLRLTVGMSGRVSFTNGVPLRVRSAPGGDVVTQIGEGTAFNVIGGPQCQGGYAWWQIRTGNAVEGWSAEGDANSYFMEPGSGVVAGNLAVLPTNTPTPELQIAVLPTSTPTPQLQIAVIPTATPQLQVAAPADPCNLAPQTRLQAGVQARTNTPNGTLAMRTSPTDELPSHQVPHDSLVTTLGESRCEGGYRVWPVAVTLNGEIVTGWVSEGTQQQYFLNPA